MKRNLILIAMFLLTPLYTYGDYVPGRTRASAESEMKTIRGEGRFAGVRSAKAIQFKTDGRGITQFQVQLDQRSVLPFQVLSVRPTRCGQVFEAALSTNGQRLRLIIQELNPANCQKEGEVIWNTELRAEENQAPPSKLLLSGPAEYYMLTQ